MQTLRRLALLIAKTTASSSTAVVLLKAEQQQLKDPAPARRMQHYLQGGKDMDIYERLNQLDDEKTAYGVNHLSYVVLDCAR